MRLDRRLTLLERHMSERTGAWVPPRLFWHDELVPCNEHLGCDIEIATGEHHAGVIHLTFGDAGSR